MEMSESGAVGYIRTSIQNDTELSAQKNEIARYCKRQSYVITKYYVDMATPGGEGVIGVAPQLG